ncbi:hypothetical protein LCGC14_0524590 [marine sediment metagenome]|uniref:Uncharacterized protein n=1 Tax=marine sediment metagenome TaxID=412755 RepID=A0A0F9S245_9ZZZZ
MIETEHPSNVKPGEWYKSLYRGLLEIENPTQEELEGFDSFYSIAVQIKKDREISDLQKINENFKKFWDYFFENHLFKWEREELITDNISYQTFLDYLNYGDYCDYTQFIALHNNPKSNQELLNKLLDLTPKLKIEKKNLIYYSSIIYLLKKVKDISPTYLITNQLYYLLKTIPEWFITKDGKEIWYDDNEHYNIEFEEPQEKPKIKRTPSQLYFSDFSFTEEQIFNIIRKNEKWHDVERDITIYRERQKGKYLDELAENFGIKFNSISMVLKKVSGSINLYKGKLFENFVYKRLVKSKLFKNVKKEAGKGEPDILAYTKDDKELYIYSLKNIKINRKPYWLEKKELRPEIERALLQTLDYKVHLILLVFDNYRNKSKQYKIDYINPSNIDISK